MNSSCAEQKTSHSQLRKLHAVHGMLGARPNIKVHLLYMIRALEHDVLIGPDSLCELVTCFYNKHIPPDELLARTLSPPELLKCEAETVDRGPHNLSRCRRLTLTRFTPFPQSVMHDQ